jgi:membrane protein
MIFLVSLMALFPVPELDVHVIDTIAKIVPVDAMKALNRILVSIFQTDQRLLSIGILGAIWAGSTGFNAMISALNSAYDIEDDRPMWKKQMIALLLTLLVGAMLLIVIFLSLLGSRLGFWVATQWGLGSELIQMWPYIRWLVMVGFSALSIELVYYIAPRLKQNMTAQIPGVALAVVLWLASSFGLGIYFKHFGQYAAVYGTLGATSALMMWFYFSSLAILVGAEVNAQMRKLP